MGAVMEIENDYYGEGIRSKFVCVKVSLDCRKALVKGFWEEVLKGITGLILNMKDYHPFVSIMVK